MIDKVIYENIIIKIQSEFAKVALSKSATKWEELSYEAQKQYLERHPKSKRKITNRPQLSNLKEKINKKKNTAGKWSSAFTDIGDIQGILNDASSFLEGDDISSFETEVGDAADINIAFPVENKQTKAIQKTLEKIEMFEGSHSQFEKLLDKLESQRKQLAIDLGIEKPENELKVDDDPNWTYTDGEYNYEKNMALKNDTSKILKDYNNIQTTKESDAEAESIIEKWKKQTCHYPFSDNFDAYNTKASIIKWINQENQLPSDWAKNKDFHNIPEMRAQLVKSFAEKVFENQRQNNFYGKKNVKIKL